MHIGTLPLHPINQPTSIDFQLNCISYTVSKNPWQHFALLMVFKNEIFLTYFQTLLDMYLVLRRCKNPNSMTALKKKIPN